MQASESVNHSALISEVGSRNVEGVPRTCVEYNPDQSLVPTGTQALQTWYISSPASPYQVSLPRCATNNCNTTPNSSSTKVLAPGLTIFLMTVIMTATYC